MKLAVLISLSAATAFGHAISISYGDLSVNGELVSYRLRMPVYEVQHTGASAPSLFDVIRLNSNGEVGRRVDQSCRPDGPTWLVCDAVYQFSAPVKSLQINCQLARVTVPNHIHLLKAVNGAQRDKAVFDRTNETADLRFRPPTAAESLFAAIAAGLARTTTTWVTLLFAVLLGFGGRSRRELLYMLLALVVAEALATVPFANGRFDPGPEFMSYALYIATAYLAFEVFVLRDARGRWIAAGALGIIHGLYYGLLARGSSLPASGVVIGAVVVQVAVAVAAWGLKRGVLKNRSAMHSADMRATSSGAVR